MFLEIIKNDMSKKAGLKARLNNNISNSHMQYSPRSSDDNFLDGNLSKISYKGNPKTTATKKSSNLYKS